MNHRIMDTTPARHNYRFPAEWESHRAVWVAWPYNPEHFDDLDQARVQWIEMVRALHTSELVYCLVRPEDIHDLRQRAKDAQLNDHRLYFHAMQYADVWLRDSGPMFIVGHGPTATPKVLDLAAVSWRFDGWGGVFADSAQDDGLSHQIAQLAGVHEFASEMVLEGGAVDLNGSGSCLTTEPCLLQGRNPKINRRMTEAFLREFLGVHQVIWLPGVLSADDTGGHVDNVARFVADDHVVLLGADETHPDASMLSMNQAIVEQSKLPDGRPLKTTILNAPDLGDDKPKLAASYTNFYIGNHQVLVPAFGCAQDEPARATLATLLPHHKVISVRSEHLLTGGGSIHCLTQQQPGV